MIETTVKIDGMMCGMCEAHVSDVIRSKFNIKKVSASHSKGQAVILSDGPLDEAALRKAIKEKTQGMTVFIVSQRAASVQRADHILVLDDGRLVGDAPHAELLHSCEVYKEICLSQLSKEEVAKTL